MNKETLQVIDKIGDMIEKDMDNATVLGSYLVGSEDPLDKINGAYLMFSIMPDVVLASILSRFYR